MLTARSAIGWIAGLELEQIQFSHGPAELREALSVNTRRDQPNGLAAARGCELTAAGTIATGADGRTNVSGVYAAGDGATAHSRSVANAIGTGRVCRVCGSARAPRAGSSPRQLLLCGLFVPRARMASALEALANALPATYAYDALDTLADHGTLTPRGTLDVAVVLALTILALVLGAATLRRTTP